MAIEAELTIKLLANEVTVAESDDPALWQKVLSAIQSGTQLPVESSYDYQKNEDMKKNSSFSGRLDDSRGSEGLANALGVSVAELNGACDPSNEPPYIHLDAKCWEALKKNTPARGAKSVASSQLAGTLLCLWFHYQKMVEKPTQAQVSDVLDKIGLADKNLGRSIKNCLWLQSRGDKIQLNPAEMSQAEAVARAFITKKEVSLDE